MGNKYLLGFIAVFSAIAELSFAQQATRCSSLLKHGGFCQDRRQACPSGSFKYQSFSNFLGCSRVDQVCCALQPRQGAAPNPRAPVVPSPPRTCGIGSGFLDRILDGRITGPCDWPFVVSIRGLTRGQSQLSYSNTLHICAGVLVANNWVLTSSFCVLSAGTSADQTPQNVLVVAGEYNVSGIDRDPLTGRQQEQLIQVEKAYLHPSYRFTNLQDIIPPTDTIGINSNAVALLKLRTPITGRCSGVACLPTPEETSQSCASYDNCIISGWGFATEEVSEAQLVTTLRVGQNRLSSRVACDFLSRRLGLQQGRPAGTTCQGPQDKVTDGCLGDEGGAILCNSNGKNWVVRGLLPFNICVNGQYNMFVTDVAPYMQWIYNTMQST